MNIPTVCGLLCAIVLANVGCGGSHNYEAPQGASRLADLRYQVASDPRDLSARRGLAHELVAIGLPGEALKHFGVLESNGALRTDDRERYAALLIARARSRVELRDVNAYLDLERAERTMRGSAKKHRDLRIDALALAALAGLRYGDKEGRKRAFEHLFQLAPTDPRVVAIRNPDSADLSSLATAAAWAFDGGALRVSLELYETYVVRNGREREHLERWLAVHRWWYGTSRSPSVLVIRALLAAGGQTCSIADDVGDFGCEEQIPRLARDETLSPKLLARARERFWQTTRPDVAAGWIVASLDSWLRGDSGDWLTLVNERVDVTALLRLHSIGELFPATAPTLLRAAGRNEDAARALEVALERLESLSPRDRAVVIAEAALQGRSPADLQRLASANPTAAPGWWMAARAARVAQDYRREAAIVSAMPDTIATDYYALGYDWGALAAKRPLADRAHQRWRDLLGDRYEANALKMRWLLSTAAAGASVPTLRFRVPDPGHLSPEELDPDVVRGLATIAATYTESPAVADRIAAEFVDRQVAIAKRGLLVAELFARLGDPVRSSKWAHRVMESSPSNPLYRMVAAASEAAVGDPTRADVLFIRAAATSGNAGAVNAFAADTYLAHGQPLHAIISGRRALQLTAPGEDLAILLTLSKAMQALERTTDSEATLNQYFDRIAPPNRERARAGIEGPHKTLLADPKAIVAAAGWSPTNPAAQQALMKLSGRRVEAVIQLALIAVAPSHQALAALQALAEQLDLDGHHNLAEDVRRERTGRSGRLPIEVPSHGLRW